MTNLRNRQKRELFDRLMQAGVTALHLDPRRSGVQVPGHLTQQSWLVLNWSHRYQISDFHYDEHGVQGSLSFARQPFFCRVPWDAVFAITDESRKAGKIWEDELPSDPDQDDEDEHAAAPPAPAQAHSSGLHAVAPSDAPPAAPTPPRSGHLRRIK